MMLRYLALALVFGIPAFGQSSSPSPSPADALPDAPSTTSQAKAPVVPTGPTAVIDTSMGRLTCKLYDKQAPITTANFIGLAEGTKEWTINADFGEGPQPPLLRRQHLPSRHPRLHDPGRRPRRHRQATPATTSPTRSTHPYTFSRDQAASPWPTPGLARTPTARSSSSPKAAVASLDGKHTIFGQCDSPQTVVLVASIARVARNRRHGQAHHPSRHRPRHHRSRRPTQCLPCAVPASRPAHRAAPK